MLQSTNTGRRDRGATGISKTMFSKTTLMSMALALAVGSSSAARAQAGHADGGSVPRALAPVQRTEKVGGAAPAAPKSKSITDNIKQLKDEITDPKTPGRIKGHEQEAEHRVEAVRERQRKDHGKPKVHDAVDLAKSVDKEPAAVPAQASPPPAKLPKTTP